MEEMLTLLGDILPTLAHAYTEQMLMHDAPKSHYGEIRHRIIHTAAMIDRLRSHPLSPSFKLTKTIESAFRPPDRRVREHGCTASGKTREIRLTPNECAFLSLLASAPGQAFSTAAIGLNLWPDETNPDMRLRSLIKRLRNKLPEAQIDNLYAQGYRLRADTFWRENCMQLQAAVTQSCHNVTIKCPLSPTNTEGVSLMEKPTPINEAIKLDKHKYIMSRTDTRGVIEFGNDYFFEISGYSAQELIGKPHSTIRHPDMPGVIFKLMWDRLKQGKNIFAVVKNLAKDGRYYWVTTKFEIKKHPVDNSIVGYMAFRQAASASTIATIEPLYKDLLEIERNGGIDASEKYLIGYLDSKRTTYDDYINEVIGNKGAFKLFFTAMAKLFGGK